jgi:hypothetical protein
MLCAIGTVNVVLDYDWNAMKWSASLAGTVLGIETLSNRQSVRIDFNHAVDSGSSTVDRLDPGKILLGE